MNKHILIINGNPKTKSFCQHLSNLYEVEAREYFTISRFNLSEMAFNPDLQNGYDQTQELEPCLVAFQQAIKKADHIIIISPIWWGGMPAKLKGLFDRSLLPNFAFKYERGNPMPVQLLTNKTSRLIFTMDAPDPYLEEQASGIITQLDHFILQYCGIEKPQTNLFGAIIGSSDQEKAVWEETVKKLGQQGA